MCNKLLEKPLFCLYLGNSITAFVVHPYFPRKENPAWGNGDLPKVTQLESSRISVNTGTPYPQASGIFHDCMLILLGVSGGVCVCFNVHTCMCE